MADSHWNRHARQWDLVGPPLRPCAQDIACFEQAVANLTSADALNALLLGVTPEIARMSWPSGSRLLALDHSLEMIRGVWPNDAAVDAQAVCASWLSMPLGEAAVEMVVADGSFALFGYPEQWRQIADHLHDVVSPGGRIVARVFVREPAAQSLDQILGDLAERRIGSFHAFKWRLAMALQESSEDGVRVGDIFEAWTALGIPVGRIAREQGWREDVVRTIDAYRDGQARYTFPSAEEVSRAFAPSFRQTSRHYPTYELGESCPIMVFDRRDGHPP